MFKQEFWLFKKNPLNENMIYICYIIYCTTKKPVGNRNLKQQSSISL